MISYTDKNFYETIFLLGRAPVIPFFTSSSFDFFAREASRIIDLHTLKRLTNIKNLSDVPENISMCTCEIAELAYQYDQKRRNIMSRDKKSESADGLSISWDNSGDLDSLEKTYNREIKNSLFKWLEAELLYRGG